MEIFYGFFTIKLGRIFWNWLVTSIRRRPPLVETWLSATVTTVTAVRFGKRYRRACALLMAAQYLRGMTFRLADLPTAVRGSSNRITVYSWPSVDPIVRLQIDPKKSVRISYDRSFFNTPVGLSSRTFWFFYRIRRKFSLLHIGWIY